MITREMALGMSVTFPDGTVRTLADTAQIDSAVPNADGTVTLTVSMATSDGRKLRAVDVTVDPVTYTVTGAGDCTCDAGKMAEHAGKVTDFTTCRHRQIAVHSAELALAEMAKAPAIETADSAQIAGSAQPALPAPSLDLSVASLLGAALGDMVTAS